MSLILVALQLTFKLSILDSSNIGVLVGKDDLGLAHNLAGHELAFHNIAVGPSVLPGAVELPVLPLALIFVTVGVGLDPLTLGFVIHPSSFEPGTILPVVSSIS